MKFFNLAAAAAVDAFGSRARRQPKPAPARSGRCAAPSPRRRSSIPAAIDSALKSLVDSKQIVGVSALVYERGQEAYFGAFGLADRENNKPMARDTIVQIFSMTKPVTGVALMQLYERGKFELDAPLVGVLRRSSPTCRCTPASMPTASRSTKPPKRPITVRDILRHTAGLQRRWSARGGRPRSTGRSIRATSTTRCPRSSPRLAKVPLAYQPGTQWTYSDAVDVQAYLVQKISGVPFDEYLKLHIFRPLGMTTHALHHPAHRSRSPAARGAVHAQRRRHVHAPVGRRGLQVQQRRVAATSPAASASSPRSTTT